MLISDVNWRKKQVRHASLPHDLSIQVIALPFVYSMMAFKSVMRMWMTITGFSSFHGDLSESPWNDELSPSSFGSLSQPPFGDTKRGDAQRLLPGIREPREDAGAVLLWGSFSIRVSPREKSAILKRPGTMRATITWPTSTRPGRSGVSRSCAWGRFQRKSWGCACVGVLTLSLYQLSSCWVVNFLMTIFVDSDSFANHNSNSVNVNDFQILRGGECRKTAICSRGKLLLN